MSIPARTAMPRSQQGTRRASMGRQVKQQRRGYRTKRKVVCAGQGRCHELHPAVASCLVRQTLLVSEVAHK